VKKAVIWGVGMHTHTPNYGGLSRELPKSLFHLVVGMKKPLMKIILSKLKNDKKGLLSHMLY
jgi:hypothetical protein